MTDTHAWGASFLGRMSRAPDPRVVGAENWRRMWLERLDATWPVLIPWLEHARRDGYWKHGSVCKDFGRIEAAVFAVGGWADGYSNAVFRLLAGLKSPRLGIVGPWGHKYPHVGVPGPAIGFLQEALRWWDHWLKGKDTGIMDEPMLRAWLQEYVPPQAHYDQRPGRWVAEPSWPSANVAAKELALNAAGLQEKPDAEQPLTLCSPQTTGRHAGEWCPYGLGGLSPELPLDQRAEDGESLVFDSAPLAERVEILGAPVVTLDLASDQPVALAAVRLNDVAPDGASTRVTYGVLNLTHRDGHEQPTALEPGRRYRVRIQLNDIGHAFPAGHRIRVAVSTAYWPIIWPAPTPATITVYAGASRCALPVRAPRAEDAEVRFQPAVTAPPLKRTWIQPAVSERRIHHDVAAGALSHIVLRDDGTSIIDAIGVKTQLYKEMRYQIRENDPASARMEIRQRFLNAHEEWHSRVEALTVLHCTVDDFIIEADLQAFDGEERVFARSWNHRIPRDLV